MEDRLNIQSVAKNVLEFIFLTFKVLIVRQKKGYLDKRDSPFYIALYAVRGVI